MNISIVYPVMDVKIAIGELFKNDKNSLVKYINIGTCLRKKGSDGKWYLCKFFRSHSVPFQKDELNQQLDNIQTAEFINRMHSEIYIFNLYGIIDIEGKVKLESGENLHVLDDDQRDNLEYFNYRGSFYPNTNKI